MSANEIRKAREKAGLTQQELADLLRCHRTTVARWEGGKVHVTYSVERAIKSVLKGKTNTQDREPR